MKAGDGEGADDRGSADRRSPAATGVLMRRFRFALMAFGLWLAQASGVMALPSSMIEPLAGDDAEARSAALATIVASGDPRVARVIEALGDGRLHFENGAGVLVEDGKAIRVDTGAAVAMPKGEAFVGCDDPQIRRVLA